MSNIVDGTVTFKLRDIRGIRLDSILTSVLDTIYPVGSIYITTNSAPPFSSLDFGAWEEVSSGRVLQGADSTHSAGSTIEAGLPNITGSFDGNTDDGDSEKTGPFYTLRTNITGANGGVGAGVVGFDASRCSSIYGSSDTVQPPAYVVHIWKRVS